MNRTHLTQRKAKKANTVIARREFLVQSILGLGTTALAGMVTGCTPEPHARKAQAITIGTPMIDRIDCDGCFEGSVPVSVTWETGAGKTEGIKITFAASTPQNVQSVKAQSPLTDDTMYGTDAKIAISGCLTDPCINGTFVFTAKCISPVSITNATQIIAVPKLGYSVSGLKDTNGTSAEPNKPFKPILITIKNCGAAGNFAIEVKNERNCAALVANPVALTIGAGGTSLPIAISGNKTDGKSSGRFKVTITPPAGMHVCDHSVNVE